MVIGQGTQAWAIYGKDATPQSGRTSTSFGSSAPGKKDGHRDDGTAPCVGLIDSQAFDIFMATIVLANVALLGIETDAPGSGAVWKRVNEGFLLTYLLELVMRFLRHGANALRDRLTLLDIVLVVLAFVDRIASEQSLARALPVLRLARVYRLLKTMSFFRGARELHVLVDNSSKAITTLLWVALMLLTVLWSCAVWVKVAIGESPAWNGSMNPLVEHEPFSSFDVHEYFGSVPRSLLTLLQVTTLSQWADHVARPVVRVYPAASIFFGALLLAAAYGLLLCIVSAIVQDAINASRRVTTAIHEALRQEREAKGELAAKIFVLLDEDGDAELSLEELREALDTTDLEQVLKELDVPVLDAKSLVFLFDRDGDGHVNQEEFISGIVAMNDDLRPRDYVVLSVWVWSLKMRAQQFQGKLDRLQQQLLTLRQKLEMGFVAIDRFLATHEDTSLRHRAVKAIRSAPPDLPLSTAEDHAAQALEDHDEPPAKDGAFARLLMPPSPAWARAFAQQRVEKTRWRTVASPFVTMRDRPNVAANHIAALRPGDVVEFDDLHHGSVRPEDLPEHPFLRCWKLDAAGARGLSGFVVPYTPSRGPHFEPSASEASGSGSAPEAQGAADAAEQPEDGKPMAPVTVATPPRLTSPEEENRENRVLATLVNKKAVLPGAPTPYHAAKLQAHETEQLADTYGLRGLAPNPRLTHLKELLN